MKKKLLIALILISLILFSSCKSLKDEKGRLSIYFARESSGTIIISGSIPHNLLDNSVTQAQSYTGIYVTVSEVEAHKTEGNYFLIGSFKDRPVEVNLLTVPIEGEKIITEELPEGKYTEIRLKISSGRVTLKNGSEATMTVPDPWIHLITPFELSGEKQIRITIIWDAEKSVIYAPGTGYILKPAYRVKIEEF